MMRGDPASSSLGRVPSEGLDTVRKRLITDEGVGAG